MLGSVAWFNDEKGYGFIRGDDQQKYFVHFSFIESDGFKSLKEGDKVEFTADRNDKGLCAKSVKRA